MPRDTCCDLFQSTLKCLPFLIFFVFCLDWGHMLKEQYLGANHIYKTCYCDCCDQLHGKCSLQLFGDFFFFLGIRGNLFSADIAGQCKGVNVIMYLSDVSLFVCCFIL